MKAYEALAKAFVDEGTSAIFGVLGNSNQHWVNAMTKLGASMYNVRHEGPGLAMAEGWASITGSPGVCTTTSGPGVTQLATPMIAASRGHTPLVAFCGDTIWGDSEDNHALDQARFAAAIECGFVRLTSPDLAFEVVQRAFYLARVESRPIMLSAPEDVQKGPFDEAEEYTQSTSLVISRPPYPHPADLEMATDILETSERTVVIVGRGAMRSGANEVVTRLAERTGALITTSLMALNWPPDAGEYHAGVCGLYATRSAIELFQEADCVIAAGASLNHYTTLHGYIFPNAKIVQIDTKPQALMGNGRPADCYVRSDARVGLELLDELLTARSVHRTGYRTPDVKARLDKALEDPTVFELEPGTLDPREVSQVLEEEIPKNFGMVISGAHASRMPVMACRTSRPFTFVNKYFGSMGKGIASVIGIAIATSKPTVLIEGDVGFMMYLSEFETAVRYKLPVLVVILNDQALGGELHQALHAQSELDPELARVSTPDLGLVGIALGGGGHLVRTIDDLRYAIKTFVDQPNPTIVDVRISQNVESIQVRRLHGDEAV